MKHAFHWQESQSRQQQDLQRQKLQYRASANADRRQARIMQQEAFLQWHSHHQHDSTRASERTTSDDQSYKLLGVTKDTAVVDIRCVCTESVFHARLLTHQLQLVLVADVKQVCGA